MPKRKSDNDNVDTQLDKLLGGRDASGKFIKRTAQIEKMRDVILKLSKQQEKMRKQMERSTKSALKGLKVENQLLKGKSRLQGQVQRLTNNLNKQRRAVERSTRSNKLFAGSFGKIAAGIGGAALAFRAFRQLQDIAGSRRSLAISGGLGSLADVKRFIGKDIAIVSGAQLVDQFLQQGIPQLAAGRQPANIKALLKLQDELSGVGTEIANRIILDLTSSFRDPKRLQGFLGALGRGQPVEQTLRRFQTQEPASVTATLRALNALEVSQVPTTGDKLLDAQRELSKLAEKLKAEFENLATTLSVDVVPLLKQFAAELKKLLGFLGGLSTKEVAIGAGIGVGALALAPSLLRGGAKLAGRGLLRGAGALLPTGGGFSAAGLAGAAAVAAPIAIGGAVLINASKKTEQSLTAALSASERQSLNLRRLDVLAAKLEKQGQPERAKRVRIERQIAGIEPAGTEKSFLFGPQLTGQFAGFQGKQLQRLNQQRSAIQSEIDALADRVPVENKIVESKRKEVQAVVKATKEIDNFAGSLKKTPTTTPSTKIERDLSLLFKRADLEIDSIEQQSELALRRSELEIAKIGPFGILQAGPEASKFLDQLQTQESVLREILGTLDLSTREGRIQSNQLLLQVRGLEREERELRRSLVSAFLDQSISQAFGAGRFSKVLLFTSEQNVGLGLRMGVFDLPKDVQKQILGSIDPTAPKVQPRTAIEILGGRTPFDINKLSPRVMENLTMKGQQKTRSNLVGSNSGQSLVNISNELRKVGQQMMVEDQNVKNQLAEDITTYRNNRLFQVQAISP